ncbi:hypothetical protein PoB_006302400 [Plakobranchus ocellatus]|uniref:Uncharacterized protein n=1 Tax=Plakobranchus ocellatus TaxID=259542 RepID=A0AAV4CX97_9GAST|nr:hypothetical protein PoB_006302400 [Plakobranchus ocellatus]
MKWQKMVNLSEIEADIRYRMIHDRSSQITVMLGDDPVPPPAREAVSRGVNKSVVIRGAGLTCLPLGPLPTQSRAKIPARPTTSVSRPGLPFGEFWSSLVTHSPSSRAMVAGYELATEGRSRLRAHSIVTVIPISLKLRNRA